MISSKAVRRQLSRVPRRWHPSTVLAIWFGIGLLPWVPGTWASLTALPLAWIIVSLAGPWGLFTAAVAVFAVGCWASARYEQETGRHDPSVVVIDEISAQWMVLVLMPLDWRLYLAGFVLFRAFDMLKVWPANVVDRRVAGGIGVMLDDMVAALYAAAVLYGLSGMVS